MEQVVMETLCYCLFQCEEFKFTRGQLVVLLCSRECSGPIADDPQDPISPLVQHCTKPVLRGVHMEDERSLEVWIGHDRWVCQLVYNLLQYSSVSLCPVNRIGGWKLSGRPSGCLLLLTVSQFSFGLCEKFIQGFSSSGEVLYIGSVVAQEASTRAFTASTSLNSFCIHLPR